MRTRLIVALAAALALLVPSAPALADPVNPITSVSVTGGSSVFPVADGYRDFLTVSATVVAASGDRRIRGSVAISRAGRVAKTWVLTTSGVSTFEWNGRVNGKIVAGTYSVTVRTVDDDGAVLTDTRTLTVSSKKRVKASWSMTYRLTGSYACRDDSFPAPNEASKYENTICRRNNRSDGYGPVNVTLRGKISDGPVRYFGVELSTPWPARNDSYGPTQMKVTGTFSQSGAGSNEFSVCEFTACNPATSGRVFATSGVYTVGPVTLQSGSPREPGFLIIAQPGHDLTLKTYTVTLTYYVLK